jgi:hypothetical protein
MTDNPMRQTDIERTGKRFGADRHDPYGPDEKVTHDVIDPTSRPRS